MKKNTFLFLKSIESKLIKTQSKSRKSISIFLNYISIMTFNDKLFFIMRLQ